MKKNILASLILAGFLLASVPVLAAPVSGVQTSPAAAKNKEERRLKAKLLQLNKKQEATAYKIKRNIVKAKANIKSVKKTRAIEKKKRAIIKKRTKK